MSETRPKQVKRALSLQKKVEILKAIEDGKSHYAVAKEQGVTRQCISRIWSKKSEIVKNYEKGNPGRQKERRAKFEQIDSSLLEWFKAQRNRNIPIGGSLLMDKAKEFAQSLSITDFRASAGWLDKWKKRHGISFRVVSGEAADVNLQNVETWFHEVWTTVSDQYSPENVYNCDETGLFWRTLPDKTHTFKTETCAGGKLSKERITVLLGCNMNGSHKLKPLVIGKSQRPRAFKRLHSNNALPVNYRANKTAWMTSALFIEWLDQLDREMRLQGKNILLLLDNCPCHPPTVPLTNVKLLFLPPNATSVCQPLDQGIIQNFKVKYRGLLLRKIINQLDADNGTSGWKIDVLDSILLLIKAWNDVTSDCIANCFAKSGFGRQERDAAEVEVEDRPCEELPLEAYANATGVELLVSPEDYLGIDSQLVTSEIPSDAEILNANQSYEGEEKNLEEDENSDNDISIVYDEPPKVSTKEFIQCLEKVKTYLLQQPTPRYEDLNLITTWEDGAYRAREISKRQAQMTDYFKSAN